jgi:hypothetical protein
MTGGVKPSETTPDMKEKETENMKEKKTENMKGNEKEDMKGKEGAYDRLSRGDMKGSSKADAYFVAYHVGPENYFFRNFRPMFYFFAFSENLSFRLHFRRRRRGL